MQEKAQFALIAEKAYEKLQGIEVVGLGTGRTVEAVIDRVHKEWREACPKVVVASSLRTMAYCKSLGIPTELPSAVSEIEVYIDGVDAIDTDLVCLKGGGGAMTGEKLCAEMAEHFIAIGAMEKLQTTLSGVLPLEVIPWALSQCARRMHAFANRVEVREGVVSDAGLPILDCHGIDFSKAFTLDAEWSQMTGVVGHGLFALTRPEMLITVNVHGEVVEMLAKENN